MRPVSVIIVSHGREAALKRCLKALRQLLYPTFEVVVVADRPTLAALQGLPQAMGIKTAPCDAQNISLARNIGLGLAAGEVVAFIDDDAVPEPTWLTHLAAVFDDAEVAAAGGYVRGRNGISWQWRGAWVDGCGVRHALPLEGERPTVLHPGPGRAVKTEGTNMAFRREVIAGIGGFDPAFRFFLDETDLNLRLARAGLATALVPLALADVLAALTANLQMIRRIAEIYGGRSGTLGSWRLTKAVMAHIVATGAVAVGDDMLEPLLGGSLLGKLSRRFGEGMVNGALTARVGVAAMDVCRPVPFGVKTRPSVRGIVQSALTGVFKSDR